MSECFYILLHFGVISLRNNKYIEQKTHTMEEALVLRSEISTETLSLECKTHFSTCNELEAGKLRDFSMPLLSLLLVLTGHSSGNKNVVTIHIYIHIRTLSIVTIHIHTLSIVIIHIHTLSI